MKTFHQRTITPERPEGQITYQTDKQILSDFLIGQNCISGVSYTGMGIIIGIGVVCLEGIINYTFGVR